MPHAGSKARAGASGPDARSVARPAAGAAGHPSGRGALGGIVRIEYARQQMLRYAAAAVADLHRNNFV